MTARAGIRISRSAAGLADCGAEARPVPAAVPDQCGDLRGRQFGGLYLHIGEVAGVHRVSLSECVARRDLQVIARSPALSKPSRELIAVGAKAADGQRGMGKKIAVHAADGVNHAVHDHAAGTGWPVVCNHGDEVLRLQALTAGVC
ncbi:MAG TPA: hypothetical protein VMA72_19725 [Streptosporangiaceae bacterium]|nr:hypothetical protein [Streptosporangiaceae bacterium]